MKKTHIILASLALAVTAQAQVLPLEFADGNGTASVDQYEGTAGSGWVGAWNRQDDSLINGTLTVQNTTPVISGDGNYLSGAYAFNGGTPGTSGRTSSLVNRQYDGGLLTTANTYSFDFRVDSTVGAVDTIAIYDSSVSNPSNRYIGNNTTTWALQFDADGNIKRGAGSGTNVGATWDTGKTYAFTIESDPTTETWGFNIFNVTDGIATASDTNIAWVSAGSLSNQNGGYFTIGTSLNRTANVVNDASTAAATWSVDNISVAAIPEPSTFALLAGTLGLGLVMLRRRRG